MAGAPLNNAEGREIIFGLAMRLRERGISKSLAAELIHEHCTSPIPKGDVSEQCHYAYMAARSEPGVMSSARYANANANAALIGKDPENPWPALSGDEEPRVWTKPLSYYHKDNARKSAELFLGGASPKAPFLRWNVVHA